MKTAPFYAAAILAGLICLPVRGAAVLAAGQEFAAPLPAASTEGATLEASSAESSLYASGTRAINESRWPDAEAIFAKVASQHGEHKDGALYWQAYAENKLGQASKALDTCARLGHEFAGSGWIHECGALEIEIHARSGKPAEPKPGDDDDLKLLALNSLMQKNESRALAQIQEILNNSESSERLRNEALFILGHHYSDITYAQVVRISLVEGDVRIARGEQNEKPAGPVWEKATSDLPLESGFSLVTGAGRAEIELENASTIYLGENSVLTFNDLHTQSGISHTEVALLSGTVTLHIRPLVAGETFILRTPTDELTTRFPNKSYIRVTGYTDAIGISGQDGGVLHLQPTGDEKMASGQTLFFRAGVKVNAPAMEGSTEFVEWDKWVADRVEKRKEAMTEVMKAAGLSSPIPGLDEMDGQGKFFECKPYGTCWEPNVADEDNQASAHSPQIRSSSAGTAGASAHLVQTSFLKTPGIPGTAAAQSSNTQSLIGPWDEEPYFPCMPLALRYRIFRDPATGKERVIAPFDTNLYPYRWAVCHAGSWVHRRHHYVWVVGHKMHHVEPVRWVKSGHTVAFVPLHPYDVKGRPPINQKEEVFAVSNKNGLTIEKMKFDPSHSVEYLKEPPREFRTTYLRPLPGAEVPRMESHMMKDFVARDKTVAGKSTGVPMHFDPKSESFMVAREITKGGRTVTVTAPVSNRSGNLQARGGSFTGVHGSSSGGGTSRSGGGGTSSGGSGGSRGGGGSSGGVSSSSTSSAATLSSSSSGSGVSSSGGGHH
ncbi:MAG: hypothetical protein ABSE46_05695 [Terracidiphilus sp.]|jgi:hypothetical protein